jgi:cell division septation protein DedD
MRFEIGAGGIFLILVGLAGLSGSVFILGMFAGYEVARQDEPNTGVALVYPVPASPPASPSAPPQAPSASPNAVASSAPVAAGVLPATMGRSTPLPPVLAAPDNASMPSRAPAAQGSMAANSEQPSAANSPTVASTSSVKLSAVKPAVRPETPQSAAAIGHNGPYSVEIQAVMDGQAALGLVNKLRSLGYPAYSVETTIQGHKWYKVRVGHFASRAEAEEAEERLHEQFNGSLTTR